jgi:glycosyltransferase involved in cell wall biosynthesis
MKVYYDSEIFLLQRKGGVSRYFSEIIANFYDDHNLDIEPFLTFRNSDNLHLIQALSKQNLQFPASTFPYLAPTSPKKALITYGPVKFFSATFASRPYVAPARGSLFHATYYRPNILESIGRRNLAITVHDFIPEKLGWNGVKNPHLGKKTLAKRANLIFCVSQVTANELTEFYGRLSAEIRVIPHGVSNICDVRTKLQVTQVPSVIYVGHRSGYKNFIQLSDALKELWSEGFDVNLTTVGPEFDFDEIMGTIGQENLKFWNHYTDISDETLFRLYRESSVFCMTSKMEGFGIPIIEALSQGTTVVIPEISIAREVAGDLGTYFTIGDVESLKNALLKGLSISRDEVRISENLKYASRFTWRHTSEKMAEAYKSLDN